MSFLSLLFKPLLVTRSKIPTYTCLSKIRGDLNQKNTAATKTMKMMVMVMVMMVMFDVNLGGDDLFSGFSPLFLPLSQPRLTLNLIRVNNNALTLKNKTRFISDPKLYDMWKA